MPTADPFEWPQGQPLFEVNWRAITEAVVGNGITAPGDLQVTSTATSMGIEVATGDVIYDGTQYSVGSAETHTLTTGDGSDDRWDTVYFDAATGSSGVREGTPGPDPEPPSISGSELLLAVVYVAQNASNVGDTNILNWRAAPSGVLASSIGYDDSTGEYGVSTVDAALDDLAEAVQLDTYPLALAVDTDMNVAGTDLTDGATTIWDTTAGEVPEAVLGGPAGDLSAYPLALAVDTDTDLAGTDLDDGTTTVWDTSAGEVPQSVLGGPADSLSAYPLSLATDTDTDLAGTDLDDGATTVWDTSAGEVPRTNIGTERDTTSVASNYVTQGEELLLAGPAGTGGMTVTLASADADEGHVVHVVDSTGNAAGDNVTVNTEGAETINGQSSVLIDTDYGSVTLASDGTNWVLLPDTFGFLELSGGTMSGALNMAGNQIQNGNLSSASLVSDLGGGQQNVTNLSSVEVGPNSDTYNQGVEVYRNGSVIGYLDNSAGNLRVVSAAGADAELVDDTGDGVRVLDGGGIEIDGTLTNHVPADDFEIAFEHERNGLRVGYIDNSGSDFRFKADNGGDAEIINDTSDGMVIRDGTGNADFDGDLEINAGNSLNHDLGSSYVEFDEETVANAANAPLFAGTHTGLAVVSADDGASAIALFAGDAVALVSSAGGAGFTTTTGNAGTHNLYYDGADYVVENQTGAEIVYDATGVGI